MALKDLLVHVDHSPHCAARIEAAASLAVRHDAHLTGLYVVNPLAIPGHLRAEVSEDIFRRQAEHALATAERAGVQFDDIVRRFGARGEWRQEEGHTVPVLSLHGRYADLVIAGQRDPSGREGLEDPHMPDHLILGVGRPVLVIPHAGEHPRIGERVLVAWDASRLATRAVNDAIPLMTGAKHVVVLAVNPSAGEDGHGEIPSADICLHLARHGIEAEAQHVFAEDLGAGAMLLSRAADHGIDLIVTGAYGHARWREIVLGGVTRHLLTHTGIPVLMCH
jgi:nucleotide-binding universal stress UspA family protein